MLGALIMLLPAGLPVRALGMLLWLPLFFPPQQLPAMGRAQVWILDVGQGLAVLIRTHGHSLLYDTGPRQGDFDLGARVVLRSLRGLGVSRLDSLVLSHEDSDHAGGAEAVLRVLPAQQLISGTDGPLARRLGTEPCVSGTAWEWDQVGFSLWRWEAARNDNQASCVLMIEAAGERLLLTGDIDQLAESALLNTPMPLKADWLLLPHHGSRGSSSEAFLAAVAPHTALISRGRHNSFGHPHPLVLKRLTAQGIAWADTAEQGALYFELGAFAPVQGWRQQARFWRLQ
jgi:competence protein ComEC